MLSRFLIPINRNFVQKSLNCLASGNFQNSLIFYRYKHVATKAPPIKQDVNNENEKKPENVTRGPFHDAPRKGILKATNDPNVFGALNHQVEDGEDDEGDLIEAEHFRKIPLRRDQLPQTQYQQMIQNHIRDKRLKEAIDILEVRMKEDRVKPEYYIYELLIIECGRLGYTKKAFQLYNRMKRRGLKVTGPVYTALFSACANTIHPKEGLIQAQTLRKHIIQNSYVANERIYNAMIKAFGRCGDTKTAFQLVDEMKDKKLLMQTDTINHLLQVCCSDKQYGFRHALYVWHKMYHLKLIPSTHSYNLILRCVRDCGIGDVVEMKTVIANILQGSNRIKLRLDKKAVLLIEDKPKITINNKDSANSDVKRPDSGDVVLTEACDQMPNFLNKLPHLGSIVKLTMLNSPQDRLMMLGGVTAFISEMETYKVRPNVKTFSQLLDVIPSTRDAEHELIEKMRYMRVRGDIDFFNLLMKRRFLRNDDDGAKQVMKMIKKLNFRPDIVTYGVMAMGCRTREQAKEFQHQLTENGVRLNIEILGALMRIAIYVKDYDYIIDVLNYAMDENIKPSSKFAEMLRKFKSLRYNALQQKPNEAEQLNFNRFYACYKKWKQQMGLDGLMADDVSKLLNVHPWKQIKEGDIDGLEPVKNKRTRRIWKIQHSLKKLSPNKLEHLGGDDGENAEKTTPITEENKND